MTAQNHQMTGISTDASETALVLRSNGLVRTINGGSSCNV